VQGFSDNALLIEILILTEKQFFIFMPYDVV